MREFLLASEKRRSANGSERVRGFTTAKKVEDELPGKRTMGEKEKF